jgi:hypothetical protein
VAIDGQSYHHSDESYGLSDNMILVPLMVHNRTRRWLMNIIMIPAATYMAYICIMRISPRKTKNLLFLKNVLYIVFFPLNQSCSDHLVLLVCTSVLVVSNLLSRMYSEIIH